MAYDIAVEYINGHFSSDHTAHATRVEVLADSDPDAQLTACQLVMAIRPDAMVVRSKVLWRGVSDYLRPYA